MSTRTLPLLCDDACHILSGISEIDHCVAPLALRTDHVMLNQCVLPFATHHTRRFSGANAADPAHAEGLPSSVTAIFGDTPAGDDPAPVSAHTPSSRRTPGEALDAPENLSKEAPGQVTFGQLEDEVPSVPNEAPAGLGQPLLETREGPVVNGNGQDEPTQQIAEVVGDDPEQETDLVGPEPVTGEPGSGWLPCLPGSTAPQSRAGCRSGRRRRWSRSRL
jgi:hypothetical protein